jgi:hypothetical protein
MPRLVAPGCGGIRERIDLLSQLIDIGKDAWMSEAYDETALIIAAIERNARLQAGPDGERLLALTTAAVSNRNIDLNRLDEEIELQFGLHSVEVTGDGVRIFPSSPCLHQLIVFFSRRPVHSARRSSQDWPNQICITQQCVSIS